MNPRNRRFGWVSSGFVALLVGAGSAAAQIYVVDWNGSEGFKDLQVALDTVPAGSTLLVKGWEQNAVPYFVTKSVTIVGWTVSTGYGPTESGSHPVVLAIDAGVDAAVTLKDVTIDGGDNVTAQVTVRNTGSRAGAEIPQLYLTRAPDGERMRLVAFEKVRLEPGESTTVTLTGDPRLLGRYDESAGQWRLAAGDYEVMVGKSAGEPMLTGRASVNGRLLGK